MSNKHRKGSFGRITKQTTIGDVVVHEKQSTTDADGLPPVKNVDYHSVMVSHNIPIKWDEKWTLLITGIEQELGRNALAELIGLSQNATFNRLSKLENLGFITKSVTQSKKVVGCIGNIIGGRINKYVLTRGWYKILGSTERASTAFDYEGAHNWAFQFWITEGLVPKSEKKRKMNNWDYYIFAAEDLSWAIQVNDTKEPSFILYPQVDLGSGTVSQLQQKYSNWSYKVALLFAQRNNIQISLPQVSREQHFELRDDAVAKAIKQMFGDMRTPHFRADDTPKKDTPEAVGEQTARAIEWTVGEMPKFASHVSQELQSIKNEMRAGFNHIEEELNLIPKQKIQSAIVTKPEPQPSEQMQSVHTERTQDPMYG